MQAIIQKIIYKGSEGVGTEMGVNQAKLSSQAKGPEEG